MDSHTIPKRLLEQFAYSDSRTKSLRLWRYRKNMQVRHDASPKSASRIPGYFKHSADPFKELHLEQRLNAEVESPVHLFLSDLANGELAFTDQVKAELARYMVLLFSRSRARREGMAVSQSLRQRLILGTKSCEVCMQTVATNWNLQVERQGKRFERLLTAQDIRAIMEEKLQEAETLDDQQNAFSSWIEHILTDRTDDLRLSGGRWNLIRTSEDNPFFLSDSPLISFSRIFDNQLSWGDGFNKPTVEVILPVSPTSCIHVLPSQNTQNYRPPTSAEINYLQALFVQESGYASKFSSDIKQLIDSYGNTARVGVNCYRIDRDKYKYYFLNNLLRMRVPYHFVSR